MRCLKCGRLFPSELQGDEPAPTVWMKCLVCGHVMAFDDTLDLRELTPHEIAELDAPAPPEPFHPLTIVGIVLAAATAIHFL